MNKELVEAVKAAIEDATVKQTGTFDFALLAAAALSSIEREGFKVAPVEPTEAMLVAWENAEMDDGIHTDHDHCRFAYRTLLSAAPKD